MTRRLLIVCYYFPPLGLAGVGRPLNLFKTLPSHGWDCQILTVKPVTYRAYEPELLDGLDHGKIFRAGSYDPQRLMYLAGWRRVSKASLESGFKVRARFFPDSKRGWVGPAVRLGKRLIEQYKYDVIISTSPPMSAHLVGMKLHQETGVKWVADFRDYWTSDTIEESYSSAEKISRARTLIRTIASSASAVTAVNKAVGDYVGAREVITNGFDADTARMWDRPKPSEQFTIGLLGTFGSLNPLEPLFQTIGRLHQRSPELADRILLTQVGNVDRDQFEAMAHKYGMAEKYRFHGLRPRTESITLLRDCCCFYQSILPKWGAGMTPARMFDLLASGRPILAYADPGSEIENLINMTVSGFCFDDARVDQAADYLKGLVRSRMAGSLKITPIPDYAEPYRWERIAEQFATLFESLL